METRFNVSWIFNYKELLSPTANPINKGKVFGIPSGESIKLSIRVADAMLGALSEQNMTLANVRTYAANTLRSAIYAVVNTYSNMDEYPEDVAFQLPKYLESYVDNVIEYAVKIVGHCPTNGKELIYKTSLTRSRVLLQVTQVHVDADVNIV